jgi:hypothetical protein
VVPAILIVSQAEAQTSTAPATPPPETPKTGTERRQERRTGRTERRQERRTGRTERARSGVQGVMSDVTRAMVLPNRRNRSMPCYGLISAVRSGMRNSARIQSVVLLPVRFRGSVAVRVLMTGARRPENYGH